MHWFGEPNRSRSSGGFSCLCLWHLGAAGLRREERPSDLVAAGGAAPMNRLIAAAIGLSDCNAPVVTALGAISGEVNGHIRSLTPSEGPLKHS